MNKKALLGMGAIALAFGAIAASFSGNKAAEVKAGEGGVEGSISIEMIWGDWAANNAGQNISVYFSDGKGGHSGWGSYEFAAKNTYGVIVDYDLTFVPTLMVPVRYDGTQTQATWEGLENRFSTKWNQTIDLTFEENANVIIESWNSDKGANNATVTRPVMNGKNVSNWDWHAIATLDGFRLNTNKEVEYYAELTIHQWEEFGINLYSDFYAYAATTFGGDLDTALWTQEGNNVKYTGANSLDITIFLNHKTGAVRIEDTAYAHNAMATEWAEDFASNVGCVSTYDAAPANWNAYAKIWFQQLTDGAKQLFISAEASEAGTAIEKAAFMHDLCVKKYSTCELFMAYTDGDGSHSRSVTAAAFSLRGVHDNRALETTLAASGVVAIGLASAAGLFFLRKKRHN